MSTPRTTATTHRRSVPQLVRRALVLAFAIGIVGAVAAGPALAQGSGGSVRDRVSDRRIGVGNVFVPKGDALDTAVVAVDGNAYVDGSTTEDVFVVSGDAVIRGKVGGSVVVLDGTARISGQVGTDVVVLGGRAILQDGAVVHGDVQSSKEPRVASGATVKGDVKTIDITGMFTALGFSILGFFWLAVTISTAILGVVLLALFGRPFDKAAETARTAPGKTIGWGILLSVGLPVLAVAAAFSLVGLPLGIGTGGALGVIGALGYVTSALYLGRLIIKAPRNIFGAFFAGWGILRVLALLPGIGVLVWTVASVVGVGALAVAAWRGSHPSRDTEPPVDATTADASPDAPTDTTPSDAAGSEPAAPGAGGGTATKTATGTATETAAKPDTTTDEATASESKPAKKAPAKKAAPIKKVDPKPDKPSGS
jgi:hypothetical protein